MDFSRVGAINYFPYISWQFLTQNNPTVNVNNQRNTRWSIFSYLKNTKNFVPFREHHEKLTFPNLFYWK